MNQSAFKSFRLKTIAKANGRNIHNLVAILACIQNAVTRLKRTRDKEQALKQIAIGKKELAELLRK